MNISGNMVVKRHLFGSKLSTAIDVIYMSLSVADIICNSLICLLFYKDKSLRKPFHVLLLNLSLADMSSAFTIQPYIWIDFTKLEGSSESGFLCGSSVGLMFFMGSGLTNILTLSAITVMRYLGIVRNYQGRLVTSNTIITSFCIVTWVIGAATNIPNGLSFHYNKLEAICYRQWPKGINGNLYSILTTFMFMVFPILTMIICYIALAVHIWKRSFKAPGQNIAAVRARKSVAMLVGLLILAFIICWSPFFTTWILGRSFNYFPEGADGEYKRQRWLRVGMIFALFNSVLDPFIYTFSSPEYRNGIIQLISAPWRMKVSTRSTRAFTVSSELAPNVEINQV